MEFLHQTEGTNPRVISECVRLAVSEAPAMVGQHITFDSPLLPLAQAEVEILLAMKLKMIGAGAREVFDRQLVELKVGVIVAIDDEPEEPVLAGFLQYTPRLLTQGVATIGYAAVHPDYRGKGLFIQLLDILKQSYPIIGLDCPLEVAPIYEKLGFKPDNVQGAHVGMSLGAISGKTWMYTQEDLDNEKLYQQAKEKVRDRLGKEARAAYAKRDADTARRAEEVKAYIAQFKAKAAEPA